MSVSSVLVTGLLLALCAWTILVGARLTRDRWLTVILFGAVAVRVAVGALNLAYGPLPGAEVDAVRFEEAAAERAMHARSLGDLDLELGAFAYSDLLAAIRLLGADGPLVPTLVNAVIIVCALLLLYRLVERLGGTQRARWCTAVTAFLPMSVLYTAVPLREAVLIFGLVLFTRGFVGYLREDKLFVGPETAIGLVVLIWFHGGFVILFGALAAGWLLKQRYLIHQQSLHPALAFIGTAVVVVGVLTLGTLLIHAGGGLTKLPGEPVELMDPEYLADLRESKARGDGAFLGDVPSSWPGLIATSPLIIARFLYSPTPLDLVASGAPLSELFKFADSLLFIALTGGVWSAIRQPVRGDRDALVRAGLVTLLGILVVAFAMGTANIGIAIRHRAKLAWLFVLVISLWRLRPRRLGDKGVESQIDPDEPTSPEYSRKAG